MRPTANPALGQSWHPAARHPRHLRERLTSRSHQELSEGFRIQSSNSEWPVLCGPRNYPNGKLANRLLALIGRAEPRDRRER